MRMNTKTNAPHHKDAKSNVYRQAGRQDQLQELTQQISKPEGAGFGRNPKGSEILPDFIHDFQALKISQPAPKSCNS